MSALRLTIAVDPGLSGAVVFLADGEPASIYDMPTHRVGDVNEIDAARLAEFIRDERGWHPGAYVSAVIEKVNGRKGWGATEGFRFGAGYGKVKAVLETLGIAYTEVQARKWKSYYALPGGDKDAARELAMRRFPAAADSFKRKKDDGRAEATLIALWYENTQLHGLEAA